MNGAIIIQADSTEQGEMLQSLLVAGRYSGPISVKLVPEHGQSQLLGRDAIGQAAKKKAHSALQQAHEAKCSLGSSRGIDMLPSGSFVLCSAVIRFANGRECVGWSQPRILPETVASVVGTGGNLIQALQVYRQRWHITDTFSLGDIEELITCRSGLAEAVTEALAVSVN